MNRALACSLLAVALGTGCGDDGNTIVDGAVPDSRAPDAALDAPPEAKEGQVIVAEAHSPIEISTAFGMLMDGPLFSPTATADDCLTMPNMSAASLSAGSITITGTTTSLTLAQEDPGDVYTTSTLPPADLFAAGATLTVTATGDTVPAFTGTVVAPEPLADVVFPASLSRASSADVTWTADSGSAVWVFVNSATETEGAILCRTTDAGSFTLTPAALAILPATLTSVSILVYRLDETEVTAGAWTIYLRAADIQSSDAIAIGS